MHFDPGQKNKTNMQLKAVIVVQSQISRLRNDGMKKCKNKHDLPGPAGCCAITALVSVCLSVFTFAIFLQINENAIRQETSTNLSGTRVSRFCLGNRSPRHSGRLDQPALRIAPQTLWCSLHSRARRREGARFRDQGEAVWEQ